MNIEEELRMLADEVMLDEDPRALADHTATCLRELNNLAGFSIRISAMASTLADYLEDYANEDF